MINMKFILKFLTATVLVSGAATSVVACGSSKVETTNNLTKMLFKTIVTPVKDNTNVTKFEANSAQFNVQEQIKKVIQGNVSQALFGIDYKVDVTTIRSGNLSQGVTVTVSALSPKLLNEATVKVTFTKAIDLKTLTFSDIDNQVKDNTNVSQSEANSAKELVKSNIQTLLDKNISETTLGSDYSLDLSLITHGNLSKGVKVIITGTSDKLVGKNTILVKFTTELAKTLDLSKISLPNSDNIVLNNKYVIASEVKGAANKVKNDVQSFLDTKIAETKLGQDYDIDLNGFIGDTDLSQGLELTVTGKSPKLTNVAKIKVTFTSVSTLDLSTFSGLSTFGHVKNLRYNVTQEDVDNVKVEVKNFVQSQIDEKILGTKLDVDYTMDLSKITPGGYIIEGSNIFQIDIIGKSDKLTNKTSVQVILT